jgi:hypothetical protein
MISLPAPVSPVINTGRSDGATPHPRGNEHVALEHQPFFDGPQGRAMTFLTLLFRQANSSFDKTHDRRYIRGRARP